MSLYKEFLEAVPVKFLGQLEERNQDEALRLIAEKIECGQKRIVYEGRTGIGKSLINYAVAKTLGNSFYLVSHVELVKQVAKEDGFYDLQEITGGKNYPCNIVPNPSKLFDKLSYIRTKSYKKVSVPIEPGWTKNTAPCYLDREQFNYKELNPEYGCGTPKSFGFLGDVTCPYAVDLVKANRADMVVSTIDMYLSSRYLVKPRKVVVIDEVHNLEGCIENRLGINIKKEDLGVSVKRLKEVCENIEDCVPLVREYYDRLLIEKNLLLAELESARNKRNVDSSTIDSLNRKVVYLDARCSKINGFIDDTGSYSIFALKNKGLALKPDSLQMFFEDNFGSHEYVIMSSATLPRPYSYFCDRFGFVGVEPIFLPGVFDCRRNPIYVPVTNPSINHGNSSEVVPKNCEIIAGLISSTHKGQKGIIGCVSGNLVKQIVESLTGLLDEENRERIISYSRATDLINGQKVQRYYKSLFESSRDAVLVGTSLEEGHDFEADLCRFIVVPKVPFATWTDEGVRKKRDKYGQIWYDGLAATKFVQLIGRGMRKQNDFCKIYVLDANFKRLLVNDVERGWGLFPKDVKDSVYILGSGDSMVKLVDTLENWRKRFLVCDNLVSLEEEKELFDKQLLCFTGSYDEKKAYLGVLVFYESRKKEIEEEVLLDNEKIET